MPSIGKITAEELLEAIKKDNPNTSFNLKSAEIITETVNTISKPNIPDLTPEQEAEIVKTKEIVARARKEWSAFIGKGVGHTVLAKEFREKVKKETGETLTIASVVYFISAFTELIRECLEQGKSVTLKNIGSFKPTFTGGKPYTDSVEKRVKISEPRIRYKFNQSRKLKDHHIPLINKFIEGLEVDTSNKKTE